MTENALYTLWLELNTGKNPYAASRLVADHDPKELYHATREELIAMVGTGTAELLLNKDQLAAKRILRKCEDEGIKITAFRDPDYPAALREIPDPPPMLFYYGSLPDPKKPSVGIVGTRRASKNGLTMAAYFAGCLVKSGFQTISGLADGIDTFAHEGSLVEENATFAVLGCGVDVVYPAKNRELYEKLKVHGGILSEYLPGTRPFAGNFPRRNRIISGLSDGILVMECRKKSGAMITARYAAEQNRTLFALPMTPDGRGDDNSGTNYLIKQGAIFTTEPADVIREFRPRFENIKLPETTIPLPEIATDEPAPNPASQVKPAGWEEPEVAGLSGEEKIIYDAMPKGTPLTVDAISELTGIPAFRLFSLLQSLELADAVSPCPGALFCRRR